MQKTVINPEIGTPLQESSGILGMDHQTRRETLSEVFAKERLKDAATNPRREMNWTTEEPNIPGIYLAMTKGSGEIVGAAVREFNYPPGDNLPAGVYCCGYSGVKSHVRSGCPLGVPMSDWFSLWALVMPIHSPNTEGLASPAGSEL